ncbi:MAG: hypothetical protein ACYTFG_20355, partial [Planctomycetota bacterium]
MPVVSSDVPEIPPAAAFTSGEGPPGAPGEEEEFDIFRYISVLLRRKTPIVIVMVLATLYSVFS